MTDSLICEKCGKNPGQPYIFHYGKKIAEKTTVTSRSAVYGNSTNTTKTYQIVDIQQVMLCHDCISKQSDGQQSKGLKSAVRGGVVLLIAILTYWFISYSPFSSNFNIPSFFLIILLIIGFFSIVSLFGIFTPLKYFLANQEKRDQIMSEDEVGEILAIELRSKSLKEQGFDIAWTPKIYKFKVSQQEPSTK